MFLMVFNIPVAAFRIAVVNNAIMQILSISLADINFALSSWGSALFTYYTISCIFLLKTNMLFAICFLQFVLKSFVFYVPVKFIQLFMQFSSCIFK